MVGLVKTMAFATGGVSVTIPGLVLHGCKDICLRTDILAAVPANVSGRADQFGIQAEPPYSLLQWFLQESSCVSCVPSHAGKARKN